MGEFYKRLLSGGVYVTILLTSILFNQYAFLAVLISLSIICLWEFKRLIHLKNITLYLLLLLFILGCHLFEVPKPIVLSVLAITIITQLLLLHDLIYIRIIPMFEKKKYIVSIFYLISCFVFMSLIPFQVEGYYEPIYILGMFILIWVNDSFAYLTGKNFGKNKLYEKISPKKTIEGFLGGLLFTCLASVIIAYITSTLNIWLWIGFGLIVSFFGTVGDLIQSKFKRQAGVKDSGSIMPGHGGIFDRFDSVLYASPFVFLYLQIINYVS